MNLTLLFLLLQDTAVSPDSLAMALEGETITFFDLMVEGGILMIPIILLFLISISLFTLLFQGPAAYR